MGVTGMMLALCTLAALWPFPPSAPLSGPDLGASKPGVFFADGFESGDFSAWDNRDRDFSDPDLKVISDPDNVFMGRYALQITARPGKGTGGKLPKWFLPGLDILYARWYCKFAEDFDQGNFMHFVHIFGGPPNNPWAAFGKAGIKPNGRDFFTTALEPWAEWRRVPPPGRLTFYTYFPDMKRAPDGNYWGNMFKSDPPAILQRGRWYCMEVMVKLNTPGKRDGEQAAWLDGRKIIHVRGIRWRDVPELKIHCFALLLYIHDCKRVNRVWFDNVVLSTRPIGPATKGPQAD